MEELALRISTIAPIAYFETDYCGGAGIQSAIAWNNGKTTAVPAKSNGYKVSLQDPINNALRIIGVRREPNQLDEFDTVGLGRHRTNEDWILQSSLGTPEGTVDERLPRTINKLWKRLNR